MSAALPLIALGGIMSASSQIQAGNTQARMASIVASQLEQNAGLADTAAMNAKAAGGRGATEALRQNKMLQSRQIALAAAQGASTSEKNISDLISRTAGQGEYEALSSIYEGDTRADAIRNEAIGLRNKATMTRYEGKQARKAAYTGALASAINSGSSISSFYGKYGTQSPTELNTNTSIQFRYE